MLNKKGFTMIELIVVTLIIATLALLVAPSFRNSQMTADIEKAKIGLVELNTAVKLYYEVNENGDLQGLFSDTTYNKLTSHDEQEDYTYLHYKDRWEMKDGSYFTVKGVNCKYYIGARNADETSYTTCLIEDDDKHPECYKFFINKSNPALVRRNIGDEYCTNM